jgi:putative ABC transport system permease protein
VIPILSQFVILHLRDKKVPVYLIGYDRQFGGGPWRLAAGREPRRDRETVFDSVLARRHGLALGDELEIMDREYVIVGLSDGTTSWMTSFVFIRRTSAESLLGAPPGASSFLLVSPRDRLSADGLHARLTRLADIEVIHKSAMIANDLKLFSRILSTPLRLMAGIAFLVGTLVVGLVIFTATVERQREYGVLKAIGARNGTLYQVVATQALIAAGAGAVLGVALAQAGANLIMRLRPQFLVVIEPGMIGQAMLIGLGMALAAALFPAHILAGLAPAEVFRR